MHPYEDRSAIENGIWSLAVKSHAVVTLTENCQKDHPRHS
jgi:hypothetical protein